MSDFYNNSQKMNEETEFDEFEVLDLLGEEDTSPEEPAEPRKSGKADRRASESRADDAPRKERAARPAKDTPRRERAERSGGKKPRKGLSSLPWHIILPIIIVILVALIGIRLYIWNKGKAIDFDFSASAEGYDVEVQDFVIPLSADRAALQADDGVTTILMLGNDPLSDDLSATGIPALIEHDTIDHVNVIAAPFPGSRVAAVNALYSTDYVDDVFNFYYLCSAISLGNFDALLNVADTHDDPIFAESARTIAELDYSKVDMIVVFYDAKDYFSGSPVWNDNNDGDIQTYCGSLKQGFDLLTEAYPHIRPVFLSLTYASYVENGRETSGEIMDFGNGTLSTYWLKSVDVTSSCGVSFIDNYYGSINENNYKELLADNIHLNVKGREKVADHFVTKILKQDPNEYRP